MNRPTWDTGKNYELLESVIVRQGMDGADVLLLLSNEYGLQLFTEEHTISLMEELGYEFD